MDAEDLRSDPTLISAINDGNTNYDQNSITILTNSTKSYQDIESNSLGKVEAQGSRPCAIIGPDRVQPPPTVGDAYLKKASIEPWPCSDNVYQLQAEISSKLPDYHQSMRNISPRQTFQENMQRIMVPPSYPTTKGVDDHILKSSKVDMPLEVKYCDVPYTINPIVSQKSIRGSDVPITAANSPYLTVQRHGWSGTVGPRSHRPYAPEFYQYHEVANFAGQQPLQRVHRPSQEDSAQGHPDRSYNEPNVRFKPYPSTRERYPQHRYEYISNYPNTYHPQLPFQPQKYDVSKTLPSHPYPMYSQVPIRRVPDSIIDPYQRPSQPNYNPYQNQYIPHPYGPVQGNCVPRKMYPYPPEMSPTLTPTKLPYDMNSKLYVDYENAKNKMYSVDNMTYFNDPKRQLALKGDVSLTMHPSMNMHHIPQHHIYRKDNMPLKPMELPHPNSYTLPHHLHFSPLARSPAESFSRMDAMHSIGGLQEDCGYVSQSSTASGRSIDSGNFRIQNEFYRKNDALFGNGQRTSQKLRSNSVSSPNKKGLDVRQFLQMWNEGEDEEPDTAITSTSLPPKSESNSEQLVILGSMTIPNEELSKYEHIQKISKLPENIKGYNSIELLDQYEQLVETPAICYNKKPMPHEYIMSASKIAKQSSLIPRPISPLDVEAKISQSVIHKEVGCNFEIKPCSPKMMNVDMATPLQNIISERTIEKVINTSVTNSQIIQLNRTDIGAVNSPSTSCKMNTNYILNEDLIKNNNYSLQDLEDNAGVCLASLPRLDSDIELNFPEINQQFIDANRLKVSTTNKDLKTIQAQTLVKSENDCEKDLNDKSSKTPELNSFGTAKLSKYRKIKSADSMPNESRIDSVIIKNPDLLRKKEIDKVTEALQEESEHINEIDPKSDVLDNTILKDMSCSAIDFSLNKLNENSDNLDSEHFEVDTNLKNDIIPSTDENETQMYALSLVTKKVEMELIELEENDYDIKTEKKHNEPGYSLGLIYEDTTILSEFVSDSKVDYPTPRVNTGSEQDVENSVAYSSSSDLEDNDFECDKANHKDEDIFKDDIVIALTECNVSNINKDIRTDNDRNKKEKYLFPNEHSETLCSLEANQNLKEKVSSDVIANSNILEGRDKLNAEKPVESVIEIYNSINKNMEVNDITHIRSPEHLEKEVKAHTKNTQSEKKTPKYENISVQLDNQNPESGTAPIETLTYVDGNNLCEHSSELRISRVNLDPAQICNKYEKDDTNSHIKEEVCVLKSEYGERNDLDNFSAHAIPQQHNNNNCIDSKNYIKHDREVMQVDKNNLICTTGLLEAQKANHTSTFPTFESTFDKSQTDDADSSSNRVNDLASKEEVVNEIGTNSENPLVFYNGLVNSEVTKDIVQASDRKFFTYKNSCCKRKKCFSKEYFSPWMQKLLIFSSGLCVKSFKEHPEDLNDATYFTNTDKIQQTKEYNSDCITRIEKNIQDLLTTPNIPSKDLIEKSIDLNKILMDECTNNTDTGYKPENNLIQLNNEENEFSEKGNDNFEKKLIFPKRMDLKRSLSDSAIDLYDDDKINKVSSRKRRRLIIENFIESHTNEQDDCVALENNRRKSISAICNNDNLLIFIADSEYIIAEEECEPGNVEYAEESAEFLQVADVYEVPKNSVLGSTESSVDCPLLTLNDINQEKWLGADIYTENVFNDDVAVDITISAPISPENSSNDSLCTDNEIDHIARIKEIYGENMCINDMQIVETLYKMPQMNVNKTLDDIESHNSLDNENNELISPHRYMERPDRNNSPFVLETSKPDDEFILGNLENRDFELPVQMNDDDYRYVSDDKTIETSESYNDCTSPAGSDCKYSASSSPEVSSTTSEDKCSGILLKITSVNGSRRSEVNNVSDNLQQLRYKFTEKNDYHTNYRPLITKAAQKYIPPIIESHDLKVKLPLPQNSLNKLKQLKLVKNEPLLSKISKHKKSTMGQSICKKVKPKFEDVLKSIDEIQFKMNKGKIKKPKHSIPKVLIKKHENGAHYASTQIKKSVFNPDLTGRKWQPWVFIERNEFVDRMAQRNKHKAVYCHRKKTFVLAEKFKKYKSICTAKFVISQPTSDHPSSGNLKYTIRLKHNY